MGGAKLKVRRVLWSPHPACFKWPGEQGGSNTKHTHTHKKARKKRGEQKIRALFWEPLQLGPDLMATMLLESTKKRKRNVHQ